ncbi:MAG: polysaccharide deacetylase family protein [bacterium]
MKKRSATFTLQHLLLGILCVLVVSFLARFAMVSFASPSRMIAVAQEPTPTPTIDDELTTTIPSEAQTPIEEVTPEENQSIDALAFPTVDIPNAPTKFSKIDFPVVMYHFVEKRDKINTHKAIIRKQANSYKSYIDYTKKDGVRATLDRDPATFEKDLQLLQKYGFTSYFIKEIPLLFQGKIALQKKSIALTFDDGYRDFYENAFPLLKKYKMKATLYVVYDYIGKEGFVTEDDIRDMVQSGFIEIGSHTLGHVDLNKTPDAIAKKEIFLSKSKLEEITGISVLSFAYPYGIITTNAQRFAREAGYVAAVTTAQGRVQSASREYLITRLRPGSLTEDTIKKNFSNVKK